MKYRFIESNKNIFLSVGIMDGHSGMKVHGASRTGT